jgi:hypothetical protein
VRGDETEKNSEKKSEKKSQKKKEWKKGRLSCRKTVAGGNCKLISKNTQGWDNQEPKEKKKFSWKS